MALGVDNFCWHVWEEPAYNKALNLREGLKVCSKCGSVKGFHRYVPREYENLGLEPPTGPVFSIVSLLTSLVLLVVGIAIFTSMMPLLQQSITRVLGDMPDDKTGRDIKTMVAAIVPVVLSIGFVVIMVGSIQPEEETEGSKVLNGDDEYEP